MNDTLKTIHDVDAAFLAVEKARLAIEAAKAALETAKQDADAARLRFEDSLSKAEEAGLPRAKLRKVAEERVNALLNSGLLKEDSVILEKPAPKAARAPRRAKLAEPDITADTESSWVADTTPTETLAEASS
jgi:hypothetical protein